MNDPPPKSSSPVRRDGLNKPANQMTEVEHACVKAIRRTTPSVYLGVLPATDVTMEPYRGHHMLVFTSQRPNGKIDLNVVCLNMIVDSRIKMRHYIDLFINASQEHAYIPRVGNENPTAYQLRCNQTWSAIALNVMANEVAEDFGLTIEYLVNTHCIFPIRV